MFTVHMYINGVIKALVTPDAIKANSSRLSHRKNASM